jgi:hypothetical protein
MLTSIFSFIKRNPIAVAMVVLLAACVVFFALMQKYQSQVTDLKNQMQIAEQNAKAADDSVHKLITTNGELAYKYAFLQNSLDSLTNDDFYKGKQIYSLQNTIADLKVQLQHSTITVITKSDTVVGGGFYNTYKDTGLSVELWDTVTFTRVSPLNWVGTDNPSFSARIKLQHTVGRNADGSFYGAVQTFSPKLTITDVTTVVNDKYIPQTTIKKPGTLAIGASLDNNTFAPGLRLNISQCQFGAEYILIGNRSIQLNSFLDRLRVNTYYFFL